MGAYIKPNLIEKTVEESVDRRTTDTDLHLNFFANQSKLQLNQSETQDDKNSSESSIFLVDDSEKTKNEIKLDVDSLGSNNSRKSNRSSKSNRSVQSNRSNHSNHSNRSNRSNPSNHSKKSTNSIITE